MPDRYFNLSGAPWNDTNIGDDVIVEPKELGGYSSLFYNGEAYEGLEDRIKKISIFLQINKPSYDYVIVSNNELGREILDLLLSANHKLVVRERPVNAKPYWQKVTRLHFNPLLEK